MYRTNRNTSQWFTDDYKPMISDRQHTQSMGPGTYDKNHKQSSKEAISWNFGKIPFGCGDERFKTDYRAYFRPGPGVYNPENMNKTIGAIPGAGSLMIDMVSQGGKNIKNMSPRQQELIAMNQTSNFKSKAPKVSIYKDEEKRIKMLHGPKKNLKYQIKLNDEILDKQNRAKAQSQNQGKLIIGPNFAEESLIIEPKNMVRNKDLFGIARMHKVGPQDYDPIYQGRKSPEVIIMDKTAVIGATGSIKKQMEDYLGNIFEQNPKEKLEKNSSELAPSTTAPISLDAMQPFTVDKRDMTFKSKILRDPLHPNKEQYNSPGPAIYDPQMQKKELLQGRNFAQFGSNAERNNLIQRNAMQPHGDPTHLQSPAPDVYFSNESMENKKRQILQQVGSSLGNPDPNMQNAFQSPTQRDFMDQISKELRANPGPGTYDTQIQDKLRVLNYQLSTRYHLKPFGSGQVRFDYQQPQVKNQRQTIDFNQMISVKDKDVAMRRSAFLQTIQHHKNTAADHQNQVFQSGVERFDSNRKDIEANILRENSKIQYEKDTNFKTTNGGFNGSHFNQTDRSTNSTFGLTFQKGSPGRQLSSGIERQLQMHHNQSLYQKENPSYGFNSTQQRFSYMKEMQKMGEMPGPGSYLNDLNQNSTIAQSTQATHGVALKQGLNTISSTGGGAFFKQKSIDINNQGSPTTRASPHASPAPSKFSTIGTSMFKNTTSREDFKHYIPQNSNNTITLKNLGPGSYFKSKSPFLKRSFNASLPPSKFY